MKYIILGHETPDIDSIVSGYLLEKVMRSKGYEASFVIPDKVISEENINLLNKYGLDIEKYRNKELVNDASYILVDHKERNVSGKIVAIIDHHPTSKTYDNISYYRNEVSSSTACLITLDNLDIMEEFDIKLTCLAALVDTASFNSTKTNENDKRWVEEMCRKYHFDYNELYKDGLCINDLKDIDKVFLNGLKKYKFNDYIVHSSYIQIVSYLDSKDKIEEIIKKLKNYREEMKIELFVFIVYSMSVMETKVYFIKRDEIQLFEHTGYVSRGSTIMPMIEKKYLDK